MACCLTWPVVSVSSVVTAVAAGGFDESAVSECDTEAGVASDGVGVDVLEGCFDPTAAPFAAESVESAAEVRKEEKMLAMVSACCALGCCGESCACSCACACACPWCCPRDVVSAGGMATSDFRLRVLMDENR